ncbi:hypothetical protein FDUTEX481_01246 [Tolypothrix sp. PCC 7601]|nr:hypothetical protein FDUTEX481_01246 [Tolypothrix sp. PCC 7601]
MKLSSFSILAFPDDGYFSSKASNSSPETKINLIASLNFVAEIT